MKRFRLSTLLLLVVIAALGVALLVQHERAARREAELQVRLSQSWPVFLKKQHEDAVIADALRSIEGYRLKYGGWVKRPPREWHGDAQRSPAAKQAVEWAGM